MPPDPAGALAGRADAYVADALAPLHVVDGLGRRRRINDARRRRPQVAPNSWSSIKIQTEERITSREHRRVSSGERRRPEECGGEPHGAPPALGLVAEASTCQWCAEHRAETEDCRMEPRLRLQRSRGYFRSFDAAAPSGLSMSARRCIEVLARWPSAYPAELTARHRLHQEAATRTPPAPRATRRARSAHRLHGRPFPNLAQRLRSHIATDPMLERHAPGHVPLGRHRQWLSPCRTALPAIRHRRYQPHCRALRIGAPMRTSA